MRGPGLPGQNDRTLVLRCLFANARAERRLLEQAHSAREESGDDYSSAGTIS